MSTKTSFKRIALVAASALAIGGLSAVPAFAATASTIILTSGTTTLTGTGTGTASATGAVGSVVNFNATASEDVPASSIATGATLVTPVLTGTVTTGNTRTAVTVAAGLSVTTGTLVNATASVPAAGLITYTTTTAAEASSGTAGYSFTPDVPGTYILTFTPSGTGAATGTTAAFTYTATLTGATFLPTGATPAPVAASVTSKSSLVAVAGGFAKFAIAQGQTNSVYYVTSTGMSISAAVATGTVTTTTNINGTTIGGGVIWAPTAIDNALLVTVTSAVAGTGTLTVSPIGATGLPGSPITGTVTWGSPLAASTQFSLVKLLAGNVATDVTVGTADTTATTVASTAGTQQFTIQAETNDQNGSPIVMAAMSASITGPGTLGIADSRTAAASSGRSLTVPLTGAFGSVSVFGDGSSGPATITVSVRNSAGVVTVIGTKTVTFTGAAASATAVKNLHIAKAGTRLGAIPTTTTGAATTVATTPAITATVVDSLGNPVAAGSVVTMTSSNSQIITVGTCAELTVDGNGDGDPTPGVFECSVSGAASAVSGTSATVTFKVGTTISAAPLTFTIGGAIATVAVTADADSYTAGQAMVLTATAKDSAGNAAFDGQDPYSTDATANKTVSGLSTVGSEIVGGVSSIGSLGGLFAPATSGDFTISGKGTNAAGTGTAFAITATVAADEASGLALDAANAATDAAENAYDEAQNATQAASDALAAVTALAKQVKKLITQVKKLAKAVANM